MFELGLLKCGESFGTGKCAIQKWKSVTTRLAPSDFQCCLPAFIMRSSAAYILIAKNNMGHGMNA